MRTSCYIFLIFFNILIGISLYAQAPKYGKVSAEEFGTRPTGEDSAAGAMMLFDGGYITLRESPESGYKVEYNIHRRILLLNDAGIGKWSEVTIPYSRKENVYSIDGATFRLQGSEVVHTDLKSNQVFSEAYSSRTGLKKFALPDAAPGTIIEYKYTYSSTNLIVLDLILLQHEIPVLFSEHIIDFPNVLKYKYLMEGDLREIGMRSGVDASIVRLTNVPACKDEPFATPVHYRQARMRLQLQQADGQMILSSWEALYKELMVDDLSEESIRKYLKFHPDWTGALPETVEDSAAWAAAAFSRIQQTFTINRGYSFYPDQTALLQRPRGRNRGYRDLGDSFVG